MDREEVSSTMSLERDEPAVVSCEHHGHQQSGDWQTVAVIPAAGSGRRMQGKGRPQRQKLLLPLAGKSIFLRSLGALALPEIEAFFIPVAANDRMEFCMELKKEHFQQEVIFCPGGDERQDSIANALEEVAHWSGWRVPVARRLVIVHDAARPLVEIGVIRRTLMVAQQTGAACVGVPVKDTIKVVGEDGIIKVTPARKRLWAVQTPQIFSWSVLSGAYAQARKAGVIVTDDATLVEQAGHPVRIVPGSYRNLKITTPEDIPAAEALLKEEERFKMTEQLEKRGTSLRVGQGFDVHRLVAGRRLVLGGVEIPSPVGLEGHSDADVLIHALIDALLGAIGGGDVGELFPDTDPAYKNIDSRLLLEKVLTELRQKGARPVNVDVTVIAQYPKLAPYRQTMRETLATLLGLSLTDVNIKATTTEGLGFTGRKEGIAAQVITLVDTGHSCLRE